MQLDEINQLRAELSAAEEEESTALRRAFELHTEHAPKSEVDTEYRHSEHARAKKNQILRKLQQSGGP